MEILHFTVTHYGSIIIIIHYYDTLLSLNVMHIIPMAFENTCSFVRIKKGTFEHTAASLC